jgi:hypothetical protein
MDINGAVNKSSESLKYLYKRVINEVSEPCLKCTSESALPSTTAHIGILRVNERIMEICVQMGC